MTTSTNAITKRLIMAGRHILMIESQNETAARGELGLRDVPSSAPRGRSLNRGAGGLYRNAAGIASLGAAGQPGS
jgi:hypothetical protein